MYINTHICKYFHMRARAIGGLVTATYIYYMLSVFVNRV